MARNKLTKKERRLDVAEENRKTHIAYDHVKVYAQTDIPIPNRNLSLDGLLTTQKLWEGYNPSHERLDVVLMSQRDNEFDYTFCAKHCPDGYLVTHVKVFQPSYNSQKGVVLIGEHERQPQISLINDIVNSGAYVFCIDYNGVYDNTLSSFPPSVEYGRFGHESGHLFPPTLKNSCAYLYALILRRALCFIESTFGKKDLIAVGIRNGCELAMILAGQEREKISALGLICGAGYVEYSHVPKYSADKFTPDDTTLSYIVALSGVSYLKSYPHPVFVGVGSNDTYSDVDRLSALETLIKAPLTVSISQNYSKNIDDRSSKVFLDWLSATFYRSDMPTPPTTSITVNRNGTVYATIKSSTHPKIKSVSLYYSYNNDDHATRFWEKLACETVGDGEYLARLFFDEQPTSVYYYAETVYVNGLISTEPPKYANLSESRVYLSPVTSSAVLFRHGAEGKFVPIGVNAVVSEKEIKENVLPTGAKGTVCEKGAMRVFVGDLCKTVENDKLLQAEVRATTELLSMSVLSGSPATVYTAVKKTVPSPTFSSVCFALTDFKDEFFRPLGEWKKVSSIAVLTPNVTVNNLTFI